MENNCPEARKTQKAGREGRRSRESEAMALLSWGGSLFAALWNNLMLLSVLLLFFALAFDFMKRRRSGNRPPGPFSLPFLGTMLHVDHNNPHLSFMKVSARRKAPWACSQGSSDQQRSPENSLHRRLQKSLMKISRWACFGRSGS